MKRPKKRAGTGHWHWPDREWLEHQHFKMGKPYKQIAREIGISKEAVLNWVEKLEVSVWNVIPKGKLHPPVRVGTGAGKRFYGLTREWLIDEYIHKDKSMWQIADEIGATAHAIMVWLRKHNVPVRDLDARNRRHSKAMSGAGGPTWKGGTSRSYQARALAKSDRLYQCEWCGYTEKLEVHHHDHDISNGALDNLAWMCRYCNMLEAQLWGLQQKGRADVLIEANQIIVRFKKT